MTRGLKLDPTTLLLLQLRANNIPLPIREHRFHATRKWRFDFAWPDSKIAIEIDGGTRMIRVGKNGIMVGGRHNSAADIEKINTAQSLCWKVYRFTPEMIRKGAAIKFLLAHL